MLEELPENFGEMIKLKHLDLYANKVSTFFLYSCNYKNVHKDYTYVLHLQISRLPLSLSELKSLRWLDLKENPLTPAVASVAGPCSNIQECQTCARNVVTYLSNVKLDIEKERLRRLNNVTGMSVIIYPFIVQKLHETILIIVMQMRWKKR